MKWPPGQHEHCEKFNNKSWKMISSLLTRQSAVVLQIHWFHNSYERMSKADDYCITDWTTRTHVTQRRSWSWWQFRPCLLAEQAPADSSSRSSDSTVYGRSPAVLCSTQWRCQWLQEMTPIWSHFHASQLLVALRYLTQKLTTDDSIPKPWTFWRLLSVRVPGCQKLQMTA